MAEIKERLQNATAECLKSYDAWSANNKDSKAREALQDAIHELRKAASRLEIDVAVSERDEMAQKPIPIPPHRDARGRHQQGGGEMMEDSAQGMQRKPQRRPFPRRDNNNPGGGNAGNTSDENPGNSSSGENAA